VVSRSRLCRRGDPSERCGSAVQATAL